MSDEDVRHWILEGEAVSEPFSWDYADHQRGDPNCHACWSGYPVVCANCGGLLHAHFEDEHYDGYSLSKKCERCGYDWSE